MNRESTAAEELARAEQNLAAWCRAHDYAGYDPFDGLNSRVFQSTPLRHSRYARLAWTQLFKRSPLNLRPLALISRERNAKGTALFALAALAQYRRAPSDEQRADAQALLADLLNTKLQTPSGIAWGYNFDWQGRAFFAPRGTPTIVPTAFAACALVEAHLAFGGEEYIHEARRACDFILKDLPASDESDGEICWSYTPIDRSRILNASLLAAETLAVVGSVTSEQELIDAAVRGARYVVHRQRQDGSWAYGAADFQSRADNFHSAFVLTSLVRIMKTSPPAHDEFIDQTLTAYHHWRESFFLADGWPKYYDHDRYPADAHSAGAAIVAFLEMQSIADIKFEAIEAAERVALWAVHNLQNKRGYFHYQRRRFHAVRIPYMRWSQAWMSYALSRLREVTARGST